MFFSNMSVFPSNGDEWRFVCGAQSTEKWSSIPCCILDTFSLCLPASSSQAFDAFIYIFFALEMVIKMLALGIFGRRCYLGDTWNRLDFFIVMAGWGPDPFFFYIPFVCQGTHMSVSSDRFCSKHTSCKAEWFTAQNENNFSYKLKHNW